MNMKSNAINLDAVSIPTRRDSEWEACFAD